MPSDLGVPSVLCFSHGAELKSPEDGLIVHPAMHTAGSWPVFCFLNTYLFNGWDDWKLLTPDEEMGKQHRFKIL